MKKLACTVAALSALSLGTLAAATPAASQPEPTRTPLAAGTRVAYQLSGRPNLTIDADLYVFDLDEITPAIVKAAHAQGDRVYAYFSAGTAEEWRDDYALFPRSALGDAMDDWPDERWLDVSQAHRSELLPVMERRIARAAALGVDGIDPDNMDAYDNAGDAGLKVSRGDAAAWLKMLTTRAHQRGLGITLKNAVDLIPDAQALGVDLYVNEEAGRYREADAYEPVLAAGVPVVCIEYRRSDFDRWHPTGMQVLWKSRDLYAKVRAQRIA